MLAQIRQKTADSLRLITTISLGENLGPVRRAKALANWMADTLAPADGASPAAEATAPAATPAAPAATRGTTATPAPRTSAPTAVELDIEVGDLRSKLDAGGEVLLVDVREPHEWQIGVIPDARLIPLGEVLSRIGEIREEERDVVVYCQSGIRSRNAVINLRDRGCHGVQNLSGGIQAWRSAGGDVVAPE